MSLVLFGADIVSDAATAVPLIGSSAWLQIVWITRRPG